MSSQSPDPSSSGLYHDYPDEVSNTTIATTALDPTSLPQAHILDNDPSRGSYPLQNNNTEKFLGHFIVFSLSELCSFIDSNVELRKAQILESAGYHKWRLVLHRFLILKLYIPEISCPRLWLRFDRRPVPGLGFVLGAGVTPANDQAILSTDHEFLVGNATWESERVYEFPPSLLELRHYLPAISEESSLYKLWPENCWMFCRLIEDLLSWGDNVLSQRGKFKHTEIARGARSRILRQVRRIHNMVEPFSIHNLLASLVEVYHLSILRSELTVAEVAATQWHSIEDWSTPLGQSLAAKLASALVGLGSRMHSKLSLPVPELFQQSVGIYRRLEKHVPGHFAGNLAGCLAWAFQGSSQRGDNLTDCSSFIEEALFLKRRLCAENPLADNHRRDLSVYLLLYSRAVQFNPAFFAGGTKSRILNLLQQARDTARSPNRDGRAAAGEQFDRTLRVAGLNQAARQDLRSFQWQSTDLDVRVSVSLEYAKQLSSNSQFWDARRCLEETLPIARRLQTKRRDKFSDIFFYYLILLSTTSYLSGDHEAGQAFYAEASDVLQKCSTSKFYRIIGGVQTYSDQLIQNGLQDAACRACAVAAQLCLRRSSSHSYKFAYLYPISAALYGYAGCLEITGAFGEACAVREELVDLTRIQYTREPAIHWALLTRALSTLAPSLSKQGRLHDARRAYEELLSVTRTAILAAREGQDRMVKLTMLSEYLAGFGSFLCHTGDFDTARDAYEEAIELTRQRIDDSESRGALADFLDQLEEEYRRGIELQRANVGPRLVEGIAGMGSSANDGTNTSLDDYWDF